MPGIVFVASVSVFSFLLRAAGNLLLVVWERSNHFYSFHVGIVSLIYYNCIELLPISTIVISLHHRIPLRKPDDQMMLSDPLVASSRSQQVSRG
mmetsp:Transcript_13004/g.27984  ORF Transcript_13004/g.27984 Transcript_13004/m.27984 type:complete len:94 (+) Transcript_13004:716-997(+)